MDIALLLLRVGLGLLLVCHATQKVFGWFNGPGISAAAVVFEQLGQRPGRQKVLLAAMCETVSGVLLVVGFATIAGAAIAAGTLFVAAGCSILKQRQFWAVAGGGEYPLVLAFVAVSIGFAGAGKYAVDARLFDPLPAYAGAIAFLVAVLAAVAPLVQSAQALGVRPDDRVTTSSAVSVEHQ